MCVVFKAAALTEVDEKASVALALVLWKNHDARHVVLLLTVLLLERRERHRRIPPLENKYIMETTSQSRPVWVYMRVLMELCPLTNCCVLAARWHVNGSTCDRGATELTAPSVYLGHNMSI